MREADSADMARDEANADEAEMQHDHQRRMRGTCKARDLHAAIDAAWSAALRPHPASQTGIRRVVTS